MELEKFLPASGNGHILITTRNPAAQIHANIGTSKFQGMDPDEAVTMLLQLAYPDRELRKWQENRQQAETIASELGYLALALKQAAYTIRKKSLPLKRYLQSLLGCRKALLSRPTIKSAADVNIAATWELPFKEISRRDTPEYRDAVDILYIFAFMHFASIPISVFTLCFDGMKASNYLKHRPLALVEPSSMHMVEDRIVAAARVLYEYSMISISESDTSGVDEGAPKNLPKLYFALHPAIHQWTRERLGKEESYTWLDCTAAVLEHSISTNMAPSGRAFRRLLLPHIDSCLQQLKNAYGVGKLPQTPEQATCLERFALVYAEAGRWKDAKPLQVRVVEFRLARFGGTHDDTIAAKRRLANTYWNLFLIEDCLKVQHGIWLSQKLFRPSLSDYLCWPLWKPTYLSHMQTLDDLTRCLWLAGKRDLSRQAGERCVEVLTQRLGPDDPLTVSAMFNLARTYLHLGNRHDEVLRLLRHALSRREHFFGPNHPDTLMAVNELGVALCAGRKQLDEAEALVRRAWETRKRVLGEEHAYTLWSANDLSKVLVEMKRFEEARVLLEDAVVVLQRTLGTKHVGMIMTKGNLSRVCVRMRDWERAKELLTELQDDIPKKHPDYIHLEWGWAYVKLHHFEDLEGARVHCESVLQIVLETGVLALDSAKVLDTAEMLLRIYQSEGREEDMRKLKRTFPRVGTGNAGSAIDLLPLEKIIRRKTQERLEASRE
jgi:tetratricopeptide (TPR) repeat protein